MIWLKINAWWKRLFSLAPKIQAPDVEAQLSPQMRREVAKLAEQLTQQHVSVREVAADEVVPESPELGDTPIDKH